MRLLPSAWYRTREVNEYSNIRMTSPPNEYSNIRMTRLRAFSRGFQPKSNWKCFKISYNEAKSIENWLIYQPKYGGHIVVDILVNTQWILILYGLFWRSLEAKQPHIRIHSNIRMTKWTNEANSNIQKHLIRWLHYSSLAACPAQPRRALISPWNMNPSGNLDSRQIYICSFLDSLVFNPRPKSTGAPSRARPKSTRASSCRPTADASTTSSLRSICPSWSRTSTDPSPRTSPRRLGSSEKRPKRTGGLSR